MQLYLTDVWNGKLSGRVKPQQVRPWSYAVNLIVDDKIRVYPAFLHKGVT
jgi:hypothetical protein